jgi:hypothetical protein
MTASFHMSSYFTLTTGYTHVSEHTARNVCYATRFNYHQNIANLNIWQIAMLFALDPVVYSASKQKWISETEKCLWIVESGRRVKLT